MIRGLGIDLIEVERMRLALERQGDHFVQRIFSPAEIAYCSRKQDGVPHYAARWAAKEAAAKALGCGLGKELQFCDVWIEHDPAGRPLLLLSERASIRWGNPTLLVSLSHERRFAIAQVLWTDGS